MGKRIILFCVLIWMQSVLAQTGFFTYTSIINNSYEGTPDNERYLDDLYNQGFLYVADGFSLYREKLTDSIILHRTENNGPSIRNKMAIKRDTLGSLYLKDNARNLWFSRVHSYDKDNFTFIEEPTLSIQWALSGEVKTIGSLECHKASATVYGRTWEAWYAPAIALPLGPWKLHGLPGLIVEAREASGMFTFKLGKIEVPLQAIAQGQALALKAKLDNNKFISKEAFIVAEERKKEASKRSRMARMAAAANENVANINVKITFAETIEKY